MDVSEQKDASDASEFTQIQLKMHFSISLFQSQNLFWLVFSIDHQMQKLF